MDKKTANSENALSAAREAVRREGALLQTILDSLTHPFYMIDVTDYTVRLANEAAVEMSTRGEATCYALAHKQDNPCHGPEHPCPLEVIRETGRPATVEHIHCDDRGRRRNVEVRAFPVFDRDGRLTHVIEYCVDTTEQEAMFEAHEWELQVNRALAELANSLIDSQKSIEMVADIVLQQARRLTGSAHGYVAAVDPETGDMVSYTLTHMMGSECGIHATEQTAVFHALPDGTYPGLWGYVLNTGRGFYTNAPSKHAASRGVPDGHIPLDNFLAVPALVDGRAVGQIALANRPDGYGDRDLDAISRMATLYALAVQRRHGETALRASEERYALAQKAARIGSWDWNVVTGQLVWSEEIEPMFGFGRGEFPGTYAAFLEAVHPDDRQLIVDSVQECIESGCDYAIEHRIVWPDGTVRWLSETGNVIRNSEGKAIRMLGVVQDVTVQKQAEQQIRRLNTQLEQRVHARTGELTEANRQLREEIERRKRLEREILEISEKEQTRIGQELHDSLGQQLTGIAIMSKVLEQKLQETRPEEASSAAEISKLINQAISETRQLSRGLHPVSLDENGLMAALHGLARTTQSTCGIPCEFRCDEPVLVANASTAVHLYRIAQEAVTNAVRHGQATGIVLSLEADGDRATLRIENDGRPFPAELPKDRGMGLQVMHYRAEVIGGILDVHPGPDGGTRVTCVFDGTPQRHEEGRKDAEKSRKQR